MRCGRHTIFTPDLYGGMAMDAIDESFGISHPSDGRRSAQGHARLSIPEWQPSCWQAIRRMRVVRETPSGAASVPRHRPAAWPRQPPGDRAQGFAGCRPHRRSGSVCRASGSRQPGARGNARRHMCECVHVRECRSFLHRRDAARLRSGRDPGNGLFPRNIRCDVRSVRRESANSGLSFPQLRCLPARRSGRPHGWHDLHVSRESQVSNRDPPVPKIWKWN